MSYPPKGKSDFFKLGDYNAVCSMCGAKRKASQLVLNWQGQWRCPEHNEARQPQDFVRAIPDQQAPSWTQPSSDTFIILCSPNGMSAISDFAVADCAIADYIHPFIDRS